MEPKKAIIIGGGPAGLTAAYEFLKTTDIVPIVIEMSDYWGGISRTVDYKGNKIDIGGHRFFSKSDVVMQWWNDILPIYSENQDIKLTYRNATTNVKVAANAESAGDKVMLVRKRKSRIFFNHKFFDYPISLTPKTVGKIGYFNTFLIGLSYLKSVVFPIKDPKTLDEFFISRFGKRLYEMFFKDYTEKVWGIPCSQISAEWGAQRIKGLSIRKTIAHYLRGIFGKGNDVNQKNTETSLIEYFLYPKFGPGQLWEEVADRVAQKGGELRQHAKVVGLKTDGNSIKSVVVQDLKSGQTEEISANYVISTMPVKELIANLDTQIPANVSEVANGLLYRDFITVGLLLKNINFELEDNWIYIQEPYVKVGRLQVFNNWSPFLVKDKNTTWVGLEYFCNEDDAIWNESESEIAELAVREMIELGFISKSEDVLDSTVIKMPKTYPAYFGSYDRFDEVKSFVNRFDNLFLVGRNGMHKYNNQDHSMLTAIQAVQNIKNGVSDKENIWAINTEQEYHEEK
ncbi:NAD(P)/FAD-dependent oxidoreductase [Flavobacterium sp. MAH-1]|uniref:NAD(P)/FAD-dependent oxidoreductase n=1 Tax=Flavobacterium agri TaxID=2743471 RepID=A0A7Y8Y2L7_9FLAO|nr:NAD(P)/FAD-dependent oxidoreductase [Flavobacterium agri]NUY81221.1 NAD(P)/FAD-dependent oxidoreductase [Flavobacterium agri]NYA71245.1 NAD(P)/FAD-dependent oxidoreductase [Flavobacterium agri]